MEVTYSIVAPHTGVFENCNLQESYRFIAGALNLGLKTLGIQTAAIHAARSAPAVASARLPQCFVTVSRYELGSGERKTIGSAQKRGQDRFLQHGSILLDFDAFLQAGCVNRPDAEIEKKIAPICMLLNRQVGVGEVVDAFQRAFSSHFGVAVESSSLTPSECQLVDELEGKYQSEEWTRGECR